MGIRTPIRFSRPISKPTTRRGTQISDKSPKDYFPELLRDSGTKAFEAQCIPTTPELLERSSYKAFLAERREPTANRLNAFLGHDADES